jgi:isopenicillin-N epimerase
MIRSSHARHWPLDPKVTYLNHGAFGSCPKSVLRFQRQIQRQLERNAMQFLVYDLEPAIDRAREALAAFLGAKSDDLVFVPNATAGANTVLRSLSWKPGDELLTTDHTYNACRNALNYVAERCGARVVIAKIPFPFRTESQLSDPILEAVTSRTRLVLLDHITSPTAIIFPVQKIVKALAARNVDTLIDGAHAPGMIPLNLEKLGAAYYTGNCHKWLCAPKGTAFLHVRRDRQKDIRPLTLSHGANSPRTDRSRFLIEFAWTGTGDPSAFLSVPEALRFMGSLLPGGWPAVMAQNHDLALQSRRLLCEAWNIEPPCPEKFLGSMAAIPLPDAADNQPPKSPLYVSALQELLREKHGIEVPIAPWPAAPKRLLRVSAQLYNSPTQYRHLAEVVKTLLA